MSSPETELFSAVINQALRDYNHLLRATNPEHGSKTDAIEARSFLTATHGRWKRSRVDICSLASINPDALRDRVLAAIERDGDLRSMLPKERRDKKPSDDA